MEHLRYDPGSGARRADAGISAFLLLQHSESSHVGHRGGIGMENQKKRATGIVARFFRTEKRRNAASLIDGA